MTTTKIRYDVSGRTARIILNRPEKRNALDDVLVKELTGALGAANKDTNVKVVVLSATGPSFCAGADLDYLSRISKFSLEENREDSAQLATLFRTIYELRKPVIAVVNGPALAGGCGLASACDFIIASREKATFGYTEVHIGFIPAIVMIFLRKRVGEGVARELILRGNIIDAQQALHIGLVTTVVPEAQLEETVNQLLEELLRHNSLTSMALSKEMFSKLHGMNLMESLDFAANMNAASRMASECKQGIAAFLNKEKMEW